MEKDLCRGLYTSLFCVIIPTLFPYFLRFWYPYILLHFKCFLLLVCIIYASCLVIHLVYLYMLPVLSYILCTRNPLLQDL